MLHAAAAVAGALLIAPVLVGPAPGLDPLALARAQHLREPYLALVGALPLAAAPAGPADLHAALHAAATLAGVAPDEARDAALHDALARADPAAVEGAGRVLGAMLPLLADGTDAPPRVAALLDTIEDLPRPAPGIADGGACAPATVLDLGAPVVVALGTPGPDCFDTPRALLSFDPGGDDRYTGAAVAGALAVAVDLGGNDLYLSDTAVASGGLAVLVEAGGDDIYSTPYNRGRTQAYASGGSAYLADLGGDDDYICLASRCQAAAESLGRAALWDVAGRDAYWAYCPFFGCTNGLGEGQAWASLAASLLLDSAGDDTYVAYEAGQAWTSGGRATFVDAAGADVYSAVDEGGRGFADGSGVAVFADLGGTDAYRGAPGADNSVWATVPGATSLRVGVGLDCDPGAAAGCAP